MELYLSLLYESPIYLIVAVVTLGAIYIYKSWPYYSLKSYGIPGPAARFPWGQLKELQRKGKYIFDGELLNTYGDVAGYYMGRQPVIVVGDLEVLEQIMVKQFHNFINRFKMFPLDDYARKMIIHSKNEKWKFLRALLSPNFSAKRLKEMLPLVQSAVENLESICGDYASTGAHVELGHLFGCFTMDVIATTGFGVKVDSQRNPGNLFVKNARDLIHLDRFSSYFVVAFFSRKLFRVLMKTKVFALPARRFFHNLGMKILKDRKTNRENTRKDLLQLMLDQQEKSEPKPNENGTEPEDLPVPTTLVKRNLTDEEIIAQSTIFFLAGYETTASTLSFIGYLMATHQDIQDKVYEEIKTVLGEETPDYNNVQRLTYLEQCAKESLRLYPIATGVLRKCKKETTIKNWTIPAGSSISIPIYSLHHNPKYWPEPMKFDPDRFSEENMKKQTKFTYMPFGAGPRICIGMRLAQLEIRMTLAKILLKYKLVPSDKTEIPLTIHQPSLLKPVNGIWVRIEER
ncbi:cytochrome P450 3A14-like [Argonauta hians]